MSNPLQQYDRSSVVTGTEGAAVLQATSGGNDFLFGRGGNDTLIAHSATAATAPSAATSRLTTLLFMLRTQSASLKTVLLIAAFKLPIFRRVRVNLPTAFLVGSQQSCEA